MKAQLAPFDAANDPGSVTSVEMIHYKKSLTV
jgi:hypothetical protein